MDLLIQNGTVVTAKESFVADVAVDQGKIVGIGTHAQLLKQCPEYYEIASSQLSQEELA